MGFQNIKDLLTSFSPSLDYFAISSGDGRIKIWDTGKGQIQTELADILSTDDTAIYSKPEKGHLSLDYTCMKWLSLDKKKKRKLECSLLVLGTGGGDVLALDISSGQLKWKASDCHPGGVSAISISAQGSRIFTSGIDGVICEIESVTGNLLRKFQASTRAISSMSVSSDEKILATAAGQLKIFSCFDYKKMRKFSGHPGAVRCIIFTKDGKYVLSSAVGEKYIAIWEVDGNRKQSASCVLVMEHPAVCIDSSFISKGDDDHAGLYILAISEVGVCYFWYGKDIEELKTTKASIISLSHDDFSEDSKGALPTIFAARFQGVSKPASVHIFVAYGLLVKPSFQKILVHSGTDIKLRCSQDGVLLPMSQSQRSKKRIGADGGVTALHRANAEDAVIPIPKVLDSIDKNKREKILNINEDGISADNLFHSRSQVTTGSDVNVDEGEVHAARLYMEERLRSSDILGNVDHFTSSATYGSTLSKIIDLGANISHKKMRETVLSMPSRDAYKLLESLVTTWQSRSCNGQLVLPWIYCILLHHSHYFIAEEPAMQLLDSLYRVSKSRGSAIQSLLQLSGRLHLITAQINKATHNKNSKTSMDDNQFHDSQDEDENDDPEVLLYGEEEEDSEISSDDD